MKKNRFGVPEDSCLYDAPWTWLIGNAAILFASGMMLAMINHLWSLL